MNFMCCKATQHASHNNAMYAWMGARPPPQNNRLYSDLASEKKKLLLAVATTNIVK